MMQKLRLHRKFTTMNELNDANRSHWSNGREIKKAETEEIAWMCKEQGLRPFTKPVRIKCFWRYKNILSDPDNIRAQLKSILDGLVMARIIPDDNLKWIKGFDGDEFVKSDKEGGEVHIYEIEK